MRKRIVCVMLVGLLCMVTGCHTEQTGENSKNRNTLEENQTVETEDSKYSRMMENLEITKDVKILASDYIVTKIHGYDETSSEAYLEERLYRTWYKTGESTPIEMNKSSFGDMKYGIRYIVGVGVSGYESLDKDIIKLYELGKDEEFYMFIGSDYELGEDGTPLSYTYLTLCDNTGESKEYYRSVPQKDFDALAAGTYTPPVYEEEETYYEETDSTYNDYYVEEETTKNPELDKTDIYFAAMGYIDEVISDSSKTEEYAWCSYKVIKKQMKELNNGLYDYYKVQFAIQFEGVTQKYTVTIDIIPSYNEFTGTWNFHKCGDDVGYGSTLY